MTNKNNEYLTTSLKESNVMSHEDYLLLSFLERKAERDNKHRCVNIKGIIVVSEPNDYKTYDCIISIPSLKIQLKEDVFNQLVKSQPKAHYMNVLCMLVGNPLEVSIYLKDKKAFYANAKEVSKLNLDNMPFLKENSLVKKYLDNMESIPDSSLNKTKKIKI